MSFILDALRKLEQERHQDGVAGVTSSSAALGRNRSRPWRSIAVMAGIAVVSGVLTASVLRVLTPIEASSDATSSEAAPPVEMSRASVDLPAPEPPPPSPPSPLDARVESDVAPAPLERSVSPPPPPQDEKSIEETPFEAEEESEPEPAIRLVGHGSPARSISEAGSTPRDTQVEEGFPQLVLQGTSVIDGEPVAVISDRRVFEGDNIDGALVIRIGERTVELEFDGQRFTLSL